MRGKADGIFHRLFLFWVLGVFMLREWVQSIVEAVIILLVLFVFFLSVSINGTSM